MYRVFAQLEVGRIHDHAVAFHAETGFIEKLPAVQAVRRCENEVFRVQNVVEGMAGFGQNTLAVVEVLLEQGN